MSVVVAEDFGHRSQHFQRTRPLTERDASVDGQQLSFIGAKFDVGLVRQVACLRQHQVGWYSEGAGNFEAVTLRRNRWPTGCARLIPFQVVPPTTTDASPLGCFADVPTLLLA
jgi:hypothetical protein